MKTRTIILACGILISGFGLLSQATADTRYSVGISVSHARDFYEPLGSYGYWVDLPTHGRCWYPAYIGRDWRPYGAGHWEWTDQGWYWVSDEPWGWATYHYGRWMYDSYYGWVWVPGTEWAPAWVSWREGGGYVGWAPLTPDCHFGPRGVLVVEHVQFQPRWWVFVEHRRFSHRHRPSTVIVNNTTIINKTVNITKVEKVVNNNNTIIVNNGPEVAAIEKTTDAKVQRANAADLWRERSERVVQRASREGGKPPPVTSTPPVGLRTTRSTSAEPAVSTPTSTPTTAARTAPAESKPRGRDGDDKKRDFLPPGLVRKADKPATTERAVERPAEAKPEKNERPEPNTPRRPPTVVRPVPTEPATPAPSPEPPRRQFTRPEAKPAPAPEVQPRAEPSNQERWQERMREAQQRERDRRSVAPAPSPRDENRGNFNRGEGLPPARPAPLPPAAAPPAESTTDSKSGAKGKDAREEWEQYKEQKRKR